MAKQYKALKPVGRFSVGDVIAELPQAQIEKLLADGVIQEAPETKAVKKEVSK